MNPKPIFKHLSPKGKTQAVAHRQNTTLAMSLAVLSLFVLTAWRQVPASAPVVEEVSPAAAPMAVTENEVLPTPIYAGFPDENTLDAFLEANPELRFARSRLAAAMEMGDDTTYLATDPAVEPEVAPEQSLDFWIDVLSRNYNGQGETPNLSSEIH